MLYKKNVNPYFNFKLADKLLIKLRKLIVVYRKNLYHTQKLQKRTYNKSVNPKNYILNNEVWLNSKYIKTKQNQKLEIKFFGLFRVL